MHLKKCHTHSTFPCFVQKHVIIIQRKFIYYNYSKTVNIF